MREERMYDLTPDAKFKPKKLWNVTHEEGAKILAETISELSGFYVKAAQIVAARGKRLQSSVRSF